MDERELMVARLPDRWWAAAIVPPRIAPGVPYSPESSAGFAGSVRHLRDRLPGASRRSSLPAMEVAALASTIVLAAPDPLSGEASPTGANSGQGSPAAPPPVVSTGEVTVLYVDFPDVVQRWDIEEHLTAGLVADKHAHIDAVISADGGRLFPALLDARYALFDSADTAIAATLAIAQGADGPGPLAVSMGLASGPASTDEYGHLRVVNQARALAELAGPCGIVLAQSTVDRLAGDVPAEARLSPMGVRRLPELNSLDHPSRLFVFGQAASGKPRRLTRFFGRLRRRL